MTETQYSSTVCPNFWSLVETTGKCYHPITVLAPSAFSSYPWTLNFPFWCFSFISQAKALSGSVQPLCIRKPSLQDKLERKRREMTCVIISSDTFLHSDWSLESKWSSARLLSQAYRCQGKCEQISEHHIVRNNPTRHQETLHFSYLEASAELRLIGMISTLLFNSYASFSFVKKKKKKAALKISFTRQLKSTLRFCSYTLDDRPSCVSWRLLTCKQL